MADIKEFIGEDYVHSSNALFHFMSERKYLTDALKRKALCPRYLGLKAMCKDDIECLEPIRQAIVDGLIPSQPMLYNLMAVRGQNYKWVLVEFAQMQIREAAGSFFD